MSIEQKLITIAENEQKVYDAGYEKGKAEGGGGDTEAAFEEGKQAEWNKFWDTYQRKGNRTEYLNGFNGVGWGNESFYPKYDIICVGDASGLFRGWSTYDPEAEPLDLKARLDECNVALDTSGATRIHYLFAMTNFTRVPKVDLTSASQQVQAYQQAVFYRSYNLETIDGIKMNENNIPYNWFSSCNALKNVTITGIIGKNGFDIHYSTKLSKASILSILNACNKANAGVTITLPKKCIDGATDTKALLENDKNVIEYFMPWDESYGVTQLPNTNIIKSSVVLTTYYATGEEAPIKSYDDGEGNIRFTSPTGETIQGTIDYNTGLINITSYLVIAQGGQIKVEYQINTPYQNALANGYTIAYA